MNKVTKPILLPDNEQIAEPLTIDHLHEFICYSYAKAILLLRNTHYPWNQRLVYTVFELCSKHYGFNEQQIRKGIIKAHSYIIENGYDKIIPGFEKELLLDENWFETLQDTSLQNK